MEPEAFDSAGFYAFSLLHRVNAPDVLQLVIFGGVFALYYESVQHGFRLSGLLQKLHGSRVAQSEQPESITLKPQVGASLTGPYIQAVAEQMVQDKQAAGTGCQPTLQHGHIGTV